MKSIQRSETFLYQPVPPKPDAVRIGLAYPYTYSVSMSSLGYLSLFRQLDEQPEIAVKRINTDNMHQESINHMELIGFSFSFELDILEIIRMLKHYDLPLKAIDRAAHHPFIFAGGPVVMTNPEPYADFFDFFLIGEGEEVLDALVQAFKQVRAFKDRREQLIALARQVPGLYVPSLYDVEYHPETHEICGFYPQVEGLPFPIEKQWLTSLDETIASTPILTEDTIFSNTFLVEVMRGCAHRCRFCLASYSMLPARGPSLPKIIERIEYGLQYTSKIGLLGALIADHPEFDALCDFIQSKEGIRVSAASLRADTLTPHIAKTFHHGGQQSVTLAIETGSERLRKRINKHLRTEAIHQATSVIFKAGIPNLKLYSMVGLPDETWSDLEDTVSLLKNLKRENPQLKIHLGCSTFVPKAATPFQWMGREDSKLLQQKQEFLRKSLVKTCDFRPTSPKWDMIQALFSRGDRRLSSFIIEFANQGANLGALNRTLKELKAAKGSLAIPSLDWYALRKRHQAEMLPWDILFLGVPKEILYKESGLATSQLPSMGAAS